MPGWISGTVYSLKNIASRPYGSHNGTSVRIVVIEHGGGLPIIIGGRVRRRLIRTVEIELGTIGVHIVGGGRLIMICMVGHWLAQVPLVLVVVMADKTVLRVVRIWPQLSYPPCLSHSLQNFLLIYPSHDRHLLHGHICIHFIYS